VGIGASAGSLEATVEFFNALPEKTGIAFIVVQHTSQNFPSLLPEILQRHTRMPVVQAAEGSKVEPDKVYVIPSENNLRLEQTTLKLFAKPERPYIAHSIDLFFRSMADELKDKAIGVVFSGLGSDGTFGSRLINRKLGMVIA
jgi:two-component system, chemotaxis family, CheB/CheR fusion protein